MMPMPKFLWSNNPAADEQIDHMSSLYIPEYLKEMIENYDEWKTWIDFAKTTQQRGSAIGSGGPDRVWAVQVTCILYIYV